MPAKEVAGLVEARLGSGAIGPDWTPGAMRRFFVVRAIAPLPRTSDFTLSGIPIKAKPRRSRPLERALSRQGREFLTRGHKQIGYQLGALNELKEAYE